MIKFNFLSAVFWIAIILSPSSQASIDPPIGNVYKIEERSLLDVIFEKLGGLEKSGEIKRVQSEMKKKAINSLEHPKGIDLPRANKVSTHYFDPSYTVKKDIYLQDGTILHKKGKVVNPLDIISLSKDIIFIDGSDEEQLDWAKDKFAKSGWMDKIILVKGSYREIMKKWKKRVYFDQLGVANLPNKKITLVQQFGIKELPSIVSQEGKLLKIETVVLR